MPKSRFCTRLIIIALPWFLVALPDGDAADSSEARQLLEKFYRDHPPRPSDADLARQEAAMNQWVRREVPKTARIVGQAASKLGQTSWAKTPPAEKLQHLAAGGMTPVELDSLSRAIAESTTELVGLGQGLPSGAGPSASEPDKSANGSALPPANVPSAEIKGTPDRVGPLRFIVPDGWEVDQRDADGPRLRKKGDAADSVRFLMVFRHPGFATYPRTPEGINRGILAFSMAHAARTASRTVGRGNYPAVWANTSRLEVGVVTQHVLLACQGQVYMISTGYAPGDQDTETAYQQLLASLDTGENAISRPTENPPSGPPVSTEPAGGRVLAASRDKQLPAERPNAEELERLAKQLGRDLANFFGHVPAEGTAYKVVAVEDGDTVLIDVAGRTERVRLLGVDTAEIKQPGEAFELKDARYYGVDRLKAGAAVGQREYLERLIGGRPVTLSYSDIGPRREPTETQRVLAYLRAGGVDVNAEMARQGYTYDFREDWKRAGRLLPHDRMEEFSELVREAQAKKRGLWGWAE